MLDSKMANRFKGSFLAIMHTGADYCNDVRFKPLRREGRPLWEFKEHGHRLFCHRHVLRDSKFVLIVLFNGWDKDKSGRSKEEDREIEHAKRLYEEFLIEYPGGTI